LAATTVPSSSTFIALLVKFPAVPLPLNPIKLSQAEAMLATDH
jgi:hypothetical protein